MSSKILSFICHVPTFSAGNYSLAPATASRKSAQRKAESSHPGGHFTAIYENERFVRFKYIHNS